MGRRHPDRRLPGVVRAPLRQVGHHQLRRHQRSGDLPGRRHRQARHRDPARAHQHRVLQPDDLRAHARRRRPVGRVGRRDRQADVLRHPQAVGRPERDLPPDGGQQHPHVLGPLRHRRTHGTSAPRRRRIECSRAVTAPSPICRSPSSSTSSTTSASAASSPSRSSRARRRSCSSACDRGRRRQRHHRCRGAGGHRHLARQGVLRRARRDQARPRRVLPGRRRAADAGDGRPARRCCSGSRTAPRAPSFFQKRVPEGRARLAADDGGQHAERHHVAGAGRRRPRPRRVGGQPRLPRLPRVAVEGRRSRARRRAAPRPRPDARRRLRRTSAPRPPRCARCSTSSASTGYPKTTGNRGLHIYVRLEPRWDSYEVRAAAVAAARELERRRPDLITAAWWKEERGERVFIDFNQNAPHKTVFGAWSARARSGGQVSTPVHWDEIPDIHPDQLTMATVPERLERQGDPWARDRPAPPVDRTVARDVRTATWRTGSWTRRGRRSTRSSRTSHRGFTRAGPARPLNEGRESGAIGDGDVAGLGHHAGGGHPVL